MALLVYFRTPVDGKYIPVPRKDLAFATINGRICYRGMDCFIAKDKENDQLLLGFGSPDDPDFIPEGTAIGLHFSGIDTEEFYIDPDDPIEITGYASLDGDDYPLPMGLENLFKEEENEP